MFKTPFFGITPPKLKYDVIAENQPDPIVVAPGEKITLFIDVPFEKSSKTMIKSGDLVKQGEKLRLYPDSDRYAVSPVPGKIESILPFIGVMERKTTAVTIRVDNSLEAVEDDTFSAASKTPGIETASAFLAAVPGKPDFSRFFNPANPVNTIVITGADNDLLTITNQFVTKTGIAAIKTGIDLLRRITGIQNVILAVPPHLVKVAGAAGAGVKNVGDAYPAAHPQMIAIELPGAENAGGCGPAFFSAEAVAEIGSAFSTGRIPFNKRITVVGKDGALKLATAPIGTHVGDILDKLGMAVESGDRIIFGGPMTGTAIYSLEHPVEPDTDTIILQSGSGVVASADASCINCGQCVRVCPADVPVNELIRYLDAGDYETAAERMGLDSCIECGYCAFVCEARIPIFQFIRLAKHALEREKAAEE